MLKDGYTITSIGLHNSHSELTEKGKSNLLNVVFPTHFEETENKHVSIKRVPFIAVRVFQNLFPLHVIDVPRDAPPEVVEKVLSVSNMFILHSWKS